MLTFTQPLSRRGLAVLCLLLTFALVLYLHLNRGDTVSGPALFEYVLHTSPPPEVKIDFTLAQEAEIEAAYLDGFRNPNPEDPCEKLKLLPYKQLSKWKRQLSRRGFDVAKLKNLLSTGVRAPHIHPVKGTNYTRITGSDGSWIIVDFIDCVVWQVAPSNFKF